jgi:hypothetical protein
VPAELDGPARLVAGDALHGEQRGAAGLVQYAGLGRRGVLRADALRGRLQPDAGRAQQVVQAVLLEQLGVEPDQPGGQVVAHQGHRLAVGQPDPLQRHHQRLRWQPQHRGDLVAGVADLCLQDPGARFAATGRQVVVEAGQLDTAVDPLARHLGPRAALADDQALVGQVEEGGAHRGPGQAEQLRQLHLILQPGAHLERA